MYYNFYLSTKARKKTESQSGPLCNTDDFNDSFAYFHFRLYTGFPIGIKRPPPKISAVDHAIAAKICMMEEWIVISNYNVLNDCARKKLPKNNFLCIVLFIKVLRYCVVF